MSSMSSHRPSPSLSPATSSPATPATPTPPTMPATPTTPTTPTTPADASGVSTTRHAEARQRALTPSTPLHTPAPQRDMPATQAGGQFHEWFLTMCAQRQVDPSTVARACGFSHATITNWRKSGAAPQPQTCRLIADYFAPYPYLLVLRYAGHLTADDLALSRDPDTLHLRLAATSDASTAALAIHSTDAIPTPEDPQPFTDAHLVARAKLAVAQVPNLPDDAVARIAHLIDLYTTAAQAIDNATQRAQEQTRAQTRLPEQR